MLSSFILVFQLLVLFACSLGVGLTFRSLIRGLPFLSGFFFCLVGGLFVIVLVLENLVYLGVPVCLSGWLVFGLAGFQFWRARAKLTGWVSVCYQRKEVRVLVLVAGLALSFHGAVPVRQGQWYSGKGYPDYLNYVVLAEFLKGESFSMKMADIGLRPWMLHTVLVLKEQRIGQSLVTAAIETWSGASARGSYAATVLFFILLLLVAVYVFLRDAGIDLFYSGCGSLAVVLIPVLTRLSLDGFLSQMAVLFVPVLLLSLLLRHELSARGLTVFCGLALAYVVTSYSEFALLIFASFAVGVLLARPERFAVKRLVVMAGFLAMLLLNACYLRNFIQFLGEQYYIARYGVYMASMAPDIVSVSGWAQALFGNGFGYEGRLWVKAFAVLLGVFVCLGVFLLERKERPAFFAVFLPCLLVLAYGLSHQPASYYAVAKSVLMVLPLVGVLGFLGLARLFSDCLRVRRLYLKPVFCVLVVGAFGLGSSGHYWMVLADRGLLTSLRAPAFLDVCRRLEEMQNERVYIIEKDAFLTSWLCYHARGNAVYVDGRILSGSRFAQGAAFSAVPDFSQGGFVVTAHEIIRDEVLGKGKVP